MTNLYQAHREWRDRPADQRFESLDALQMALDRRRDFSVEDTVELGALQVQPTSDGDIELHGLRRPVKFSNWSFSSLCQRIGAPPKYLAELPADLVAANVNTGLVRHAEQPAMVFTHLSANPKVAAFTSERYGRLYDADLVRWVRHAIEGTGWRQPLANPPGTFGMPGPDAKPSGLFASDRDVFMLLIDPERMIEFGNEQLARGVMLWNSETGSKTFGMVSFLWRRICGNLICWNVEQVQEIRIRHVGRTVESRALAGLTHALDGYRNRDTREEVRIIQGAIQKQVAPNNQKAIEWLRGKGFTQDIAQGAVLRAEIEEGSTGTLWNLVNGLTAVARTIPHQDQKVQLERKAGDLLALVG